LLDAGRYSAKQRDLDRTTAWSLARVRRTVRHRCLACEIFYFNNSPKFEQNDLSLSKEGVSLVDTWTVSSIIRFTNILIYNLPKTFVNTWTGSSIIRFTNIPIYNLAKTSGRVRLSYRTLPPPTRISQSPFLDSSTPRRRPHVFYRFTYTLLFSCYEVVP
jgi:hypothetical protein